ncbi:MULTISPECIES: hypothetical protein [Pedobacter]|uniref:2'-5' RNA ligase n=1 Tax=Pedobacter zeae TaxID=1737356 RepID=A0A7W6K8Y9_9SPHI|nr:hypothetical protein [Pedobacter zeae]MBB4107396.1 hypothetical protein [Pedobacter zeae]GGH07665.1 hypothetical protein GCM10007422_24850 [Pedobacter zeae]
MNLKLNRDWYSVVIYPQAKVIDEIAVMKDKFAAKIGWFASRNSKAHITVVVFMADQYELNFYIEQIEEFCYTQKQQEVVFDQLSLSKFSRAIVLLPNDLSKAYLTDLLKRLRKQLRTSQTINGSNAHISIGRELSSAQIELAENLYDQVSLKFNCDTVAIRKFNETKRQFEVIKTFKFLENPLIDTQYLLFN